MADQQSVLDVQPFAAPALQTFLPALLICFLEAPDFGVPIPMQAWLSSPCHGKVHFLYIHSFRFLRFYDFVSIAELYYSYR